MLSYRTKNKKICQRIRMFVICEKSILQILEKIIRYCYLKRTRCYKVVYKAAVATGEFI